MVTKGEGSSGGGKGSSGLSKAENWENHNLNSAMRVDLSREEKRMKKIEELRMCGVDKKHLKLRYDVPPGKQAQDPEAINPLNIDAAGLITVWSGKRQDYIYLQIFGKNTPQAQGDMGGIVTFIDEKIKPRLMQIQSQVIELGGEPVMAPDFFSKPLEHLQVPTPPTKGKK